MPPGRTGLYRLADARRRPPLGAQRGHGQPAGCPAAVIEQTGKTSLRVLVRDAVGLVERHYIDAALQLSDGNRTAAAELLGLSRQGFYKKLAQYEMEGIRGRPPIADC